jgi:hypothetical protein
MSTFALWAFGDAHVGTDLKRGRQSLAAALRTVERGGDGRLRWVRRWRGRN